MIQESRHTKVIAYYRPDLAFCIEGLKQKGLTEHEYQLIAVEMTKYLPEIFEGVRNTIAEEKESNDNNASGGIAGG